MHLIQKETLQVDPSITSSFKETLRQAGYAAVDRMIETLPAMVEGKDLEEASMKTREAVKEVGAAVFEKILMQLGAEEQSAKNTQCPECKKVLKSPKNTRRTVDTQFGKITVPRS